MSVAHDSVAPAVGNYLDLSQSDVIILPTLSFSPIADLLVLIEGDETTQGTTSSSSSSYTSSYKYSNIQIQEIDLQRPPEARRLMDLFRLVLWCSLLLLAFCLGAEGRRLGCQGESGSCMNRETAPPEDGSSEVHCAKQEVFEQRDRRPPGAGLATGEVVRSELRWAPSGPDPLHHNGSPKKPQTP
ncbi:hypothetical protein MUK42_32659 [Musa troglodytarum]|uniref:Uncharacterized protein n=1 Tax=Musa troglodytarum TaxID=320322 RepID=A0A9E7F5W5_9LILI|nr:hypothetical protein MUK42_32659 [Musa troglodytarum]